MLQHSIAHDISSLVMSISFSFDHAFDQYTARRVKIVARSFQIFSSPIKAFLVSVDGFGIPTIMLYKTAVETEQTATFGQRSFSHTKCTDQPPKVEHLIFCMIFVVNDIPVHIMYISFSFVNYFNHISFFLHCISFKTEKKPKTTKM